MDCERKGCGHPLSWHNPCHGTIAVRGKDRPCRCTTFEPADRAERVARLTDRADRLDPTAIARELLS